MFLRTGNLAAFGIEYNCLEGELFIYYIKLNIWE